jgi:hypothetical protein
MTSLNSLMSTPQIMNQNEALRCTVCRRPKASLRTRKSKLNPGMSLLLCNECFEEKREPRFLIILIARDQNRGGLRAVRDYIRNHRYYGEKIKAEEIVP